MNDHCAMYETLTMEEKLLINIEMKKWMAGAPDLCLPIYMFKLVELDFIEKLKRKEKHGGSSHRRRNDL